MTHARMTLPAISPVHAAIAAHRAAYDAFQIAPEGEASERAETAYDDASMAVVSVACATTPEALALFRHLAWWVLDEAEFSAGHQPAYSIAMARAKDLSLYLSTFTTPAPIPQAAPSGRLAAYYPRRSVPVIDLRSRVSADAPETGKTNAVITRAINEPSKHLAEIVAKAALALDDFERFNVRPGHKADDGERIVHTVLREVAAFQVEADAAPVAGTDFGPDAHIAELAAEFCEAYAANNKADRAHMAGDIPEAEWTPYYRRTVQLMDRLEATEPKTLLGMALKCLAPIGLAGWNAPADGNTDGMDPWERVGAQLVDALLADTLAPLSPVEPRPADLLAAAGLTLEALPIFDLSAILDAAEILSEVAAALTCQPRQMTKGSFNGAGVLIESTAFALHNAIDAVARELRGRVPADKSEQAERLAALARLTIHNDHDNETAALARELLAMVEQ